jgi:hypothetical protein
MSASERIDDLDEHYRKCCLAAGNIRRSMPQFEKEPWRLQQIVEDAQVLKPWTSELDKVVRSTKEAIEKNAKAQATKKDLETELLAVLKRIAAGRSSGQTCADDTLQLAQVLHRAKEANAHEDLLNEGEQQLKAMKREGCQRTVAEHRLRLAMTAKDFGEIERSLREVRALGGALLNGTSSSARGERTHHVQSARLMDSATAMLRHLGDMATRKQAAEAALVQKIEGNSDSLPSFSQEAQAGTTVAQQGTDAWVKEVMEVVHEAKQVGVAPSLIDHAKQKIRQKRRIRLEEMKATAALKRTLQKKNASTQELLRNMRKVERFQKTSTESANTRPQLQVMSEPS